MNRHFKIPPKLPQVHRYKKLDAYLNTMVNKLEQGLQKDDTVIVVVEAKEGNVDSIKEALQNSGARLEATHDNLVQMACSLSDLRELAESGAVSFVRQPFKPTTQATSEGVAKIGAVAWQTAGYGGAGVKVAVLDVGFNGYQGLLGSELPSQVTAMSFRADGDITGGGENHGTACAEIIHDVAPDAELYLVNIETDVELAEAVEYLKSQHVDIINHAVVWYNTDYGNGTGPIDAIADDATVNGILWLNAAGNNGETHWKGTFTDSNYDGIHEWAGNDIGNEFYAEAGESVSIWLRWPMFGNSFIDYDLYLCDASTDEVIAWSENYQTGPEPPIEQIDTIIPASGDYYIALVNYTSSYINYEVEVFSNTRPLEYCVSEGSLVCPSDAGGVIAVGATDVDTDILESYSSRGPRLDGIFKPELSAPDATLTSQGRFYGTSAAVSHASGAAALAKGRFQGFTYLENEGFLEGHAIDSGPAGRDYSYGYGRTNLLDPSLVPNTIFVSTTGDNLAGNGTQGNPYKTIQKGIDSSSQGDTVYVESGIYQERLVLKTGITLQGENQATIIECTEGGQAITGIDLHQCVKIDGFCITQSQIGGDGIMFQNSDLVLTNNRLFNLGSQWGMCGAVAMDQQSSLIAERNTIEGNLADRGAGIRVFGPCATIKSNIISGNEARESGGGIYIGGGSNLIVNNQIVDNSANGSFGEGGGVYVDFHEQAQFINNTVADNYAPTAGGIGATLQNVEKLNIKNCIVWGNGDDLYGCTATYSDIQDGDSGTGNISQNPQFAFGFEDYFGLSATSPCIDRGTNTGAPEDDIRGIARPQDGDNDGTAITDMGAREYRFPHTVYVDDSNVTGIEDGSLAHPFNTIGEANNLAEIGDIIEVADGTYTDAPGGNGEVFPLNLGEVKLVSENGPETTVIECTDLSGAGPAAISVKGGSPDQGICGFTLRGGGRSTLSLSDCFVQIDQNIIEGSDLCGIYAGQEDGVGTYYSGGLIRKNIIRNNGGPGIVVKGNGSAAYVENNFIYGNSSAGGSGWDAAGVSVVANDGEYVMAYLVSNTIINNTGGNGRGVGFTGTGTPDGGNITAYVSNCIVWENTVDLYGVSGDYSDIGTGNTTGTGNISQDPQFKNPTMEDYTFEYDSPCVDTGMIYGPDDDFFGNPRPALGGYDMGAYECQVGAFDHFTFNYIGSPKTSGQAFPITVTAKDPYENTITNFSGTVSLTDLTGTITPTTTTAFTGGSWTGNATITQGRTANRITATSTSPSVTGQSNSFDVNAPTGTPQYGATYQVSDGFTNPMQPGGTADFTVQLTNTGSLPWIKQGNGPNAVRLAFHWYNAAGQCVAWDCARTDLPSNVYYNQTVTVNPHITAPNVPGSTYILKFDLVREGVTWFSSQGVAMSANQTAIIGTNYGATYQVSGGFTNPMQPGGTADFTVQVTNTGLMTWTRFGGGPQPVRLAFHWYDASGNLVAWDCVRTDFAANVAPGETATVTPHITAPNVPGATYVLRFDLVREGVTWFSQQGVPMSAPQTARLSNYGATYQVSGGFTNPMQPGGTADFTVQVTNTGHFTWVKQGNGPQPVRLAFHWYDGNGNLVAWDCVRKDFDANVAPGETATVTPRITAPNVPGATYILRFDLVREGVTWFSQQGVPMSAPQTARLSNYGATYQVAGGFENPLPAGARRTFNVQLTNTGHFTWVKQGNGPQPVRLAFHWYDGNGNLVAWDCVRTDLPGNVNPGDTVTINPEITAPNVPGSVYVLRFDLVREGVTWFSQQGVSMSSDQIANMTQYGATYTVTNGFPNPMAPGSSNTFTVQLTNTGTFTWVKQGNGPQPARLAFHWYDGNGNLVAWDCVRTDLPNNVAPGGSATVNPVITTPYVPGATYILKFDLVREGVTWFSSKGVPMSEPQTATLQ